MLHRLQTKSFFRGKIQRQKSIVVTAAQDMDHIKYNNTNIHHIVYPLLDTKHQNIFAFFDNFYHLVERAFLHGSILVHCAAGISRSATLVLAYLIKKYKWTFKQAIMYVRKERPIILPNLGFERQLKKYEETVRKSNVSSKLSRRSEAKTSESGKNSSHALKTDILPMLGVFGKVHFKEKLLTLNLKHLPTTLTDKDIQILKIYHHPKRHDANTFKKAEFSFQKKTSSISKYLEEKYDFEKKQRRKHDYLEDKLQINTIQSRNYHSKIYHDESKRSPTERGSSFYNLKKQL